MMQLQAFARSARVEGAPVIGSMRAAWKERAAVAKG